MKMTLLAAGLVGFLALAAQAQPCYHVAREVAPVLSAETRALYEKNLTDAEAVHLEKPNAADSIIWLGRRMGYLGRYKDAVRVFSSGLVLFKNDARFLRHRGHRQITLRCFDDAIRDLEAAAKLVQGKPDEIEPDGIPNAKNIPTSTLQSNIWYHLGLAYYLKGNFKAALRAYEEAQKVSTNSDMRVATSYWQYMTLRRLGKKQMAKKILEPFAGNINLIENEDYLRLIRFYRGDIRLSALLNEIAAKPDSVSRSTLLYGLGRWYLDHGPGGEAERIFRSVIAGNQWASFGFIAAEVEVERLQKIVKPIPDIIVKFETQGVPFQAPFIR
jgi:tetratricopeptide (TPR) repeat protein